MKSYYRARYYDPSTGRFLSEDPIGLHGGLNLYRPVGNDPVNFVDPSGMIKSRAECQAILEDIKRLSVLLAKELAKYDPIRDGAGGERWTKGGHYIEMTNYGLGLAHRIADYSLNCRSCDGNPSIPKEVWKTLKDFQVAPRPLIQEIEVPEKLDPTIPTPVERFNHFMNNLVGPPQLNPGTKFTPFGPWGGMGWLLAGGA